MYSLWHFHFPLGCLSMKFLEDDLELIHELLTTLNNNFDPLRKTTSIPLLLREQIVMQSSRIIHTINTLRLHQILEGQK